MKPGKTGISRILQAARYSMKGLLAAWREEAAFRQEVLACIVLMPLAFYLGRGPQQVALLLMPLFILLIAELTNSAIEAVVDRVGDEFHELSGRAKDIGSAVVMIAIFLTATVWGLIIYANYFAVAG